MVVESQTAVEIAAGTDASSSLRQDALARFEIDSSEADIEPLGNGLINDSWRVSLPAGGPQYVLQRINRTAFPEPVWVMENIVRVGRHLSRKYRDGRFADPQRRCLVPLEAADGQCWWVDSRGGYWRLFDFISGSIGMQHIDSASTAYQTGFGFGRFVADLDDLPAPPLHETIAGFHDTVGRLRALQAARADAPALADGTIAEADRIEALAWLPQRRLELSAAAPMPLRVVHNDTKVDNLLFDRGTGEALCVIDLDTVMPGLVIHDFGDMVRNGAGTLSNDGNASFSLDRFSALTRGYLAGTANLLTASEVEFFPLAGPLLALELGGRFLTDYLRGDVYFKVTFEGQNLIRCRQQLDLAELMLAQTGAMTAIVEDASTQTG